MPRVSLLIMSLFIYVSSLFSFLSLFNSVSSSVHLFFSSSLVFHFLSSLLLIFSSLVFHLLSSLFSSLLFSSLFFLYFCLLVFFSSSLLLFFSSSSVFSSLSFVFLCLLSRSSFSVSLCLSLHLCLRVMLCVLCVVCVVWLCVLCVSLWPWCVFGVWCVYVCCGTLKKRGKKNRVWTQKKFPCVHSKRPRVYHQKLCIQTTRWNLKKACEDLSWNHRTSTPHRSETNGIAERAVRRVKEGTSAVLVQSGVDEKWWSYSMECCCYLRSVQDMLADEKTPYEKTIWRTAQKGQ